MAKTVPVNMQVEPVQQARLTMAASILNKDRAAFIPDVACREAMDVLLNRRVFTLMTLLLPVKHITDLYPKHS